MSRLPPDERALKSTVKALTDAVGGSPAASLILGGKSQSLIRSYGNQNEPERFMPINDVLALECAAGKPIVSAWMLERAAADPDRPRSIPSPSDLPRLAKELSDVLSAKSVAWSDGHFCEADRLMVLKELREAIDVLCDMRAAVEAAS